MCRRAGKGASLWKFLCSTLLSPSRREARHSGFCLGDQTSASRLPQWHKGEHVTTGYHIFAPFVWIWSRSGEGHIDKSILGLGWQDGSWISSLRILVIVRTIKSANQCKILSFWIYWDCSLLTSWQAPSKYSKRSGFFAQSRLLCLPNPKLIR